MTTDTNRRSRDCAHDLLSFSLSSPPHDLLFVPHLNSLAEILKNDVRGSEGALIKRPSRGFSRLQAKNSRSRFAGESVVLDSTIVPIRRKRVFLGSIKIYLHTWKTRGERRVLDAFHHESIRTSIIKSREIISIANIAVVS